LAKGSESLRYCKRSMVWLPLILKVKIKDQQYKTNWSCWKYQFEFGWKDSIQNKLEKKLKKMWNLRYTCGLGVYLRTKIVIPNVTFPGWLMAFQWGVKDSECFIDPRFHDDKKKRVLDIIWMQLEAVDAKAGRKAYTFYPNEGGWVHSCFQNYPKATQVRKSLFQKTGS
jgi:hypothetical protein